MLYLLRKGETHYTQQEFGNWFWVCSGSEEWTALIRVQLFATSRTMQAMGFSRPEHWSGQPFLSPGDLPNPGIKPRYPTLQADPLPAELQENSNVKKGLTQRVSVCLCVYHFIHMYRKRKKDSLQFSHLVVSDSLRPNELQHPRPPCLSPVPGVYLNSCPSSRWCHPAI